jgi:hypothetical protein
MVALMDAHCHGVGLSLFPWRNEATRHLSAQLGWTWQSNLIARAAALDLRCQTLIYGTFRTSLQTGVNPWALDHISTWMAQPWSAVVASARLSA